MQTSPLPLGYRAPRRYQGSVWAGKSPSWRAVQQTQKKDRCARILDARNLERETGFEPATSTLARSHSTAELLPLVVSFYSTCAGGASANEGSKTLNPYFIALPDANRRRPSDLGDLGTDRFAISPTGSNIGLYLVSSTRSRTTVTPGGWPFCLQYHLGDDTNPSGWFSCRR